MTSNILDDLVPTVGRCHVTSATGSSMARGHKCPARRGTLEGGNPRGTT
jgi:hypothetical protein